MRGDRLPRPGEDRAHGDDPWILVTNDDGVDSPALLPLLASLETLGPARALVPDRECSWSSKTLTRFGRLRLRRVSVGGRTLHTLDGSPADCTNAGVHNLAQTPPRLAVCGINIGANAGLAFVLSSGTVGAAVEAALSGVPAIAFSLQLRPDDYARWRRDRRDSLPPGAWEQAAAVAREITSEVLRGGLPEGARLLSVNLPPGAGPGTRRVLTRVARSAYGRFFRGDGDGRLEHVSSGLRRAREMEDGDLDVLEKGWVSITPLSLELDTGASPGDRSRFERPPGC